VGQVITVQALGYYLRTTHTTPSPQAAVRLAGPRHAHADVTFPVCPGCGYPQSPVFRVDFRAPPIADLGLWTDSLVALICHNHCDATPTARGAHRQVRWWNHRDPLNPTDLDPTAIRSEHDLALRNHQKMVADARKRGVDIRALDQAMKPAHAPPVEDYEFEEVAVELVARTARDPDPIDTTSRVGSEPAWLQSDFQQEPDGDLVEVGPDPPACPQCRAKTTLLLQWSDTEVTPRRVRKRGWLWRPDPTCVLSYPFIRFWFGCPACKIVGSLAQLD
jgi:hypothetical protein